MAAVHAPYPTTIVPVNPSYQTMIVEQLSRALPAVRARRMFGGVGIYSEEAFFALIADDVLYFKVGPDTRGEYEARGLPPFRPFGEGGAEMQYFQVPEDVVEDIDELRRWSQRAVAVARRSGRSVRRGGRP